MPTDRRRITIRGIVQGVGFRPFVYALARDHGLAGTVLNDSGGVRIEVEGPHPTLHPFIQEITSRAPPLAVIESVEVRALPPAGFEDFRILASEPGAARRALICPDVAPCEDCLGELRDPADRRHRYPFLNCTNCGPRFTIVEDIPYDRSRTSMKRFPLCPECQSEYEDPGDRRFHAQPTACSDCGPALAWITTVAGEQSWGDPLEVAVRRLVQGGIVAIKGVGGFHLACDARDERTVARLRARKGRDAKPFALMVSDLEATRALCRIDFGAEELLSSPRRPIVLLARRPDAAIAPSVAPGMPALGVMLPSSPLHALLLEGFGGPLVMTSGNLSGEPMAYRDAQALERLGGAADGFLTHDRQIVMRCDDSVIRWTGGRAILTRRARGWAPQPVSLTPHAPRTILALGGHQNNAFCLARGGQAFMSHHIGDLDTLEAAASLAEAIAHYERLFEIEPEVVACDLHPEYRSTRLGNEIAERRGLPLIGVQHHHAHAASVMAEHGLDGPALGIVLDGTGYGPDGTVWGFEFLQVDGARMRRLGRLEPVPLPGGEAAVREPWRMACAWLRQAFGGSLPDLPLPLLDRLDRKEWALLEQMIDRGVNTPLASSAGRLFDAVAALAGIRERVSFEGQAAMELEAACDGGNAPAYPIEVADCLLANGSGGQEAEGFEIRFSPAIRSIAEELAGGGAAGRVAAGFHATVVEAVVAGARRARDTARLGVAVLSGGTFQNAGVLEGSLSALQAAGFDVRTNERVPPNDGGLALGQAAVAAARLAGIDGDRSRTRRLAAPASEV